ncbi:hypothetical protein JTE90_022116 [Oedothorax gibbosus]|uniref:Gem-associated protein 5 n=1 Tax=Oedothorax gibbosus TaxID=931172 RepID=A0AAV6VTP8_9ARAC|nr:hypothetical protein JTE90_022116 [Oedothorax gibbosus]
MASSGALLLPSINRNVPRVVTQSHSGIIAYASRNNIYFIDARCNPPLILDSKFIFAAHAGSIISLSYSKHETKELLASIGDDREMKIWDLESQTCVQSITVKHLTRLAEWIYGSSNTIVYSSDPRIITKWNTEKEIQIGTRKVKTGIDMMVTQLASNEKCPHLLAVGYISGSIGVLNIDQETVLYKLKVHSNEITSLSWSPVTPDILLSASLDLSIRMWKMGEVQPIWSHYMHAGRQRHGDQKKMRIVAICHPKNSDIVICSNLRGDIGEIVFGEKEKPKFENEKCKFSYYYQGNCDLNCKASFAFFLTPEENGKSELLYCFDPFKLTVWDVAPKRLLAQTPFMCQFVFDLTVSSLNPNLMAISNGEGILKVWNSQSEATRLDMVSVFIHFKTRIMTTAWHPVNENLIAYGTDEGRVGMIDIVKRKLLYTFETHHTDTVYCLGWGPCEKAAKSESGKTEYYIYSVGGGTIYVHKENNVKGKALNFDDLVEFPSDLETSVKTHSDICWKLDYSCVCTGSYKGYIDIYDSKLLFLKRFNVQMKSVECLRWHPQVTYMSPEGSHLKSWLAACGNEADIFIVDTSNINEDEKGSQKVMKKLVGHKKRVVSVCWSQHKDGFLVSAAKDGSALVWDVLAGNIIATYLDHLDVVYTVHWSVFDQDVIYSGGQDSSVRVWKISQQKVLPISDKGPIKKKKLKKPVTDADIEIQENLKAPKIEALASSNKEHKKIDNETVSREHIIAENYNKKALFPHYAMATVVNNEENIDDCIRYTDILCDNRTADLDSFQSFESWKSTQRILSTEDTIKFGLFSDQLTALKMCDTQADLYKAAGDQPSNRYVQIMAGNMKSAIEEAAETRSLNHFLVAMAPSVSYSFWLEMCEKYAAQLAAEHIYNQSCFYYLACGKIYEAINVLAEKSYIVDALALAKARLPETDPLIPKLVQRLIVMFGTVSKVGKALCYLSLNEALSAAKELASAGKPNYVRVAAYICRKFNLSKEADEYRFLCMERCLVKYDYSAFKLLVVNEPCMQVYSALVAVHGALSQQNQLIRKQDFVLYNIQEMFDFPEFLEERWFWKGNSSEQSFAVNVQQLISKELMDTERASLVTILDALETFTVKRMTVGTNDVHISIAVYITKFILLTLLENTDAATEIFLKIFEASHNMGLFPKIMWALFFPLRLSWKINSSHIMCTNIATEQIENPVLQSIQFKVVDAITNYTKQPLGIFVMPNDLKNNLYLIINKVSILLSIEKVEEHLLAYFVSSFINDLMKFLDKKEFNVNCQVFKRNISIPSNQTISKENCTLFCQQNDDVKLCLQEAEEKAKTFFDQKIIETNHSPNKISEVPIESCSNDIETSLTDGVVQSESQVKDSQISIVDVANDETESIGTHTTLIPTTDISETPNREISVKDITADENVNISNDNIVPKVDIQDNECIIPSCDNLEDISDDNQTKDKNNLDAMIVSEVCANGHNDRSLNGATTSEEDLSNNETKKGWLEWLLPIKKENESTISVGIPTPENESSSYVAPTPVVIPTSEKDLSDNKSDFSVVSTPEQNLSIHESQIPVNTSENNGESPIHVVASPPEKDISYTERSSTPVTVSTPVKDNENPVSVAVPSAERDLSNHENPNPFAAVTPEIKLLSHESLTAMPTLRDGLLHHEKLSSIADHSEDKIQSDKQEIDNMAFISEDPNKNGTRIPSDSLTEMMTNGINDSCVTDVIHTQCLQNIDMFYNVVSFVAQSICKDEFALLYYLKEKVKLLNQIRASEELNKFSKQKKADAEVFITAKKSNCASTNLKKSVLLKETVKQRKDVASDEKVADSTSNKNSESCANVNSIDVELTNLSVGFTEDENEKQDIPETSQVGLREDTNDGLELLDQNQELCTNKVIVSEQMASFQTIRDKKELDASEIISGTSEGGTDKDLELEDGDLKKENCAKCIPDEVSIGTIEDEKKRIDVPETSLASLKEDANKDFGLEDGDQNKEIYVNVVNSVSDEVAMKILNGTEVNLVVSGENTNNESDKDVLNPSITQEHSYVASTLVSDTYFNPNLSEEMHDNTGEPVRLNTSMNQEHSYACQVESSQVPDTNSNLTEEMPDDTGVTPSNLQNEIKEISELINVLEKNSEKFHYPNPFDVIPKMLKTLYIVERKFACKVVQEKLHELIHEIISWAKRYFVGDINFVCKICRTK